LKAKLHLLAVLGVFTAVAAPARANGVPEPSFAEKVGRSDLVLIGTVTQANRVPALMHGGYATLTVLTILKGEAGEQVNISTYSPVAELDPQCCDVGATYLMFLRRLPDGQYVSVRGRHGMTRVGGSSTGTGVVR